MGGAGGGEADPIAKGHVHDGLGRAVLHCPGGLYFALGRQIVEGVPSRFQIFRGGSAEAVHRMPRLFELGRQHLARLNRSNGKGEQRGGDIQIQEGAGHGVLAADGRRAEAHLSLHGAQKGGEGLAPAFRVLAKFFKVFL